MTHPLNRYRNYEEETNQDAYEYERRQYEREEKYLAEIDKELERDYFGEEKKQCE